MKLKLLQNELGLLRTEDGKWGIRQHNEHSWILQRRDNPHDPWDWSIIGRYPKLADAVKHLRAYLALYEEDELPKVTQCDHADLDCPPGTCDWSSRDGRDG